MFDLAWLLFAFPTATALINLLFGSRLGNRVVAILATVAVLHVICPLSRPLHLIQFAAC